MAQTKSQIFADKVFARVSCRVTALGQGTMELKKYKSLCKRSGGMLRTMGLVHFMTFLQARGQRSSEVQHRYLLEDLHTTASELGLFNKPDLNSFMSSIRAMQLPAYMHLTREVLRLLEWHKRLSDILIEGTAETEEKED